MIWIFLLGFLAAFNIPIIWNYFVNGNKFYIFYLCHISFSLLFFFISLIKYDMIPNDFGNWVQRNIFWERRFLGLSILSYVLFIKYFIAEFWKDKILTSLINFSIGCTVFCIFIVGIILRVNVDLFWSELLVCLISIINFIAIFWIASLLILKRNKHLRILGVALIIISTGQLTGILFHATQINIFNSPNPNLVIHAVLIIEVILFNLIITDFHDRSRGQLIVQQEQLKVKNLQLERAALQAQMNPHFIFNCLNSIQNFIMSNDKENAMEYLVKFAKLIRQSLNFSNTSKVTLDQEIAMLSNYIDLEKLRFKDKFDYHIVVSSELTPEEINIPTLLIQPFVENAIIHGLKDIQKDGLIEVLFAKNGESSIRAIIRDNGNGLSKTNKLNGHKSLGMSITSKRIAHNNNVMDGSYSINPSHTSSGTEIDIVIQL